ncbi:hypothetical protein NBO_80g0014 [Nosema bombycis CQ1]|uniref:Uncharacterized protein n=1 Tax=Nosema bombycis (strain CQ1 / CVCC 102059) TaxID=578461 RepID=R0KRH9_NOSB1|nr:hypothetical protein NBO_80g0014 [Nosema bombycis CQ1]|eukprot:EOB13351.1 hypothetical protein NBO_80g0014 [Nosema bombycis CQ1]
MKYIYLFKSYWIFLILENATCSISKSHRRKSDLPLCLRNPNPYIQCATLNLDVDSEIENLIHNEIFKDLIDLIENLSDEKDILEKINNEQDFNNKSFAIVKTLIDISKWKEKSSSRNDFLSYLNESIKLIENFRPLLVEKKKFSKVKALSDSIEKIISQLENISILLPRVIRFFVDKKDDSRFKSVKDALNSFQTYIKELKKKFADYQISLFKNFISYNEAYNLLQIQEGLENIVDIVKSNEKWGLEEINASKSSYECVFRIFTLLSTYFKTEIDHSEVVLEDFNLVCTTKNEIIDKLESLKKTVIVKIRKYKIIQSK